jgi:hypothetical protein
MGLALIYQSSRNSEKKYCGWLLVVSGSLLLKVKIMNDER